MALAHRHAAPRTRSRCRSRSACGGGGRPRASFDLVLQSVLTLAIVTPDRPSSTGWRTRRWPTPRCSCCSSSGGRALRADRPWTVAFGAEGFRNPSFWDAVFRAAADDPGQTIIIFGLDRRCHRAVAVLRAHARAEALRATAVNRWGARLMGISTSGAGRLTFALAAFMGALSGCC